ncbi:MAG TPA: HU family DNA-binding protein [Caulobacteraceae bacterium]|jgi:DNA-binding protein HU-beta
MTKAEMVDAIAENARLTKSQARDALEAFVNAVASSLKGGKEVRLVGFGSFVPVERKAGMARNPRTGAQVRRPASRTCRFRVGDTLKSALNG